MEQFRGERLAVTGAGQSKGRGERHEKDDAHDSGDRTGHVFG